MIPRSSFRELLERDGLSEKTLATDEAMQWAGQELGASAVIVGTTHHEYDSLRVTSRVLLLKKEKRRSKEERLEFSCPNNATGLNPVDPFSPNTKSDAAASRVVRAGVNGASSPVCQSCPLPSYTGPARDVKLQGSVVLDLTISSSGDVLDSRVVRGLPFGLTRAAVRAVQDWKLKPAIQNNAPVAAVVIVEVSFRLF